MEHPARRIQTSCVFHVEHPARRIQTSFVFHVEQSLLHRCGCVPRGTSRGLRVDLCVHAKHLGCLSGILSVPRGTFVRIESRFVRSRETPRCLSGILFVPRGTSRGLRVDVCVHPEHPVA